MNDVVLADAGLPSRIERLTAALSTSTQRCYRNGWRKWEAFALDHGATLFPATPEALAAFVEHLAAAGAADNESVFGLSTNRIKNRIKDAAKAAGLEGVSSHGCRIGMAQDLARTKGIEMPAIMQAGGWRSETTVAKYTARENAARGADPREGVAHRADDGDVELGARLRGGRGLKAIAAWAGEVRGGLDAVHDVVGDPGGLADGTARFPVVTHGALEGGPDVGGGRRVRRDAGEPMGGADAGEVGLDGRGIAPAAARCSTKAASASGVAGNKVAPWSRAKASHLRQPLR